MCGNEKKRALFIVRILEAEEPRDLMKLKLPKSQKVARKQKASRERGPPRTDRGVCYLGVLLFFLLCTSMATQVHPW